MFKRHEVAQAVMPNLVQWVRKCLYRCKEKVATLFGRSLNFSNRSCYCLPARTWKQVTAHSCCSCDFSDRRFAIRARVAAGSAGLHPHSHGDQHSLADRHPLLRRIQWLLLPREGAWGCWGGGALISTDRAGELRLNRWLIFAIDWWKAFNDTSNSECRPSQKRITSE